MLQRGHDQVSERVLRMPGERCVSVVDIRDIAAVAVMVLAATGRHGSLPQGCYLGFSAWPYGQRKRARRVTALALSLTQLFFYSQRHGLMEAVVERSNMLCAYERVVKN